MFTRVFWRSLMASALVAAFTVSSTISTVAETAAVPAADNGAADSADAANLPDPPGRVGRLSFMEGAVSFHAADQDQWSPATVNFPVTTGDSFWTEPNARAEIEAGGIELRMDQTTAIDIARLDDQGTQIQIDQGTVNLHMAAIPEGGVQIFTPHGNVTLTEPGWYHIDAGKMTGDQPGPQVQVTVFEGEARIDAPSGTRVVGAGESVIASGDPVAFAPTTAEADDFDDWARSREPQAVAGTSAPAQGAPAAGTSITWNAPPVTPAQSPTLQYVSPDVTGYQDLDTYGSWTTVSDYGPVWYPTSVPVGWAPYRYGHWAYVMPWGWTWIDDAPWGFAPFHYGRWVRVHDRWGWCPGRFDAHPIYAPALVAFIGGDDFGISISIGRSFPAVGWVPLAPHEVFRPYYHASPRYVREVNVTNVTVVNNITVVNSGATAARFANSAAATVVPAESFRNAAPVERARVTVARSQLAEARVRDAMRDVRPTRAARSGVAIAAAADRVVPKAGVAATIVTAKAGTASAGAQPAEFKAPQAPGPKFEPVRAARSAGDRNPGVRSAGVRRGNASTPGATVKGGAAIEQIAPAAGSPPAAKPEGAPGPAIRHGNAKRESGSRFMPLNSLPAAAATKPAASGSVQAPSSAPGPAIVRGNVRNASRNAAAGRDAPGKNAVATPGPAVQAPAQANSAPGPAILLGSRRNESPKAAAKPDAAMKSDAAKPESAGKRQARSRFPASETGLGRSAAAPSPAIAAPRSAPAAPRITTETAAPKPVPEPARIAAPRPAERRHAQLPPPQPTLQSGIAPAAKPESAAIPHAPRPAAVERAPAQAQHVERPMPQAQPIERAPVQVQRVERPMPLAQPIERAPVQVQRVEPTPQARRAQQAAPQMRRPTPQSAPARRETESAQRPARGNGPQRNQGDDQRRNLE